MISKLHSKEELYQYWEANDSQLEEINEILYLIGGFEWHTYCLESATSMSDYRRYQSLLDIDKKQWDVLRESYSYLPANIEWFI